MKEKLQLYVSVAPELESERDAIGQLLPRIPTSLGWIVTQTPRNDQPIDALAVMQADIHLLILGEDIRAPLGVEWQLAKRAGRSPTLFQRDMLHTLAADAFMRELAQHDRWRTYRDSSDLGLQVAALLAEHLQSQALGYALTTNELARLQEWRQQLSAANLHAIRDGRGSMEAGGVILSAERFVPSEGKLVTRSSR